MPAPTEQPAAARHRHRRGGEILTPDSGFSLLEMMIASFMSLLVVGGILLMLQGLQNAHHDQQELIDAQHAARLALAQMQRDIKVAGVGLTSLLAPYPVIVPFTDGFALRHNQGAITTSLAADMPGPTGAMTVADTTGFDVGMTVAVYDGTGAIDTVTLTGVDAGNDRLLHDGAGKAYRVIDGTIVSRVQTISYTLQPVNDAFALMRQEDDTPPQPVATNVVALNITYFDDLSPPQPFVPATLADQLRIRSIKLDLQVRTENPDLDSNQHRNVALAARVTPRAVWLAH